MLPVGEMTAIVRDTVLVLGVMCAQCSLVEVVELLASNLLLALHVRFMPVLGCGRGTLAMSLTIHSKAFTA